MHQELNIADIRIDGGTQARVKLSSEVVDEYAESTELGAHLPDILVFFDGSSYWLADGFHRFHAARRREAKTIAAEVQTGTQRDAILCAAKSNTSHGLRRTAADKRQAVLMLLADPEWSTWSDSRIATHCGVSRRLVRAVIDESQPVQAQDGPVIKQVERGGKTYAMKVPSKADRPAKPEKHPVEPEETLDSDMPDDVVEGINALVSENERLTAALATAHMDATPEERQSASQLIADLHSRVATLEAENKSIAAMRDALMDEVAQLKRQCASWRKKAEKAEKNGNPTQAA
jgi:hypothetical protein